MEYKVQQEDLIKAVKKIMDFCQEEDMTELLAYMAMISITSTMEEELGFNHKRRQDG